MEKEDQDSHFRKLIQAAGPEEPHADFTQRIMARVQLEASEEVAFTALLQQHAADFPSPLFTDKLLTQLQPAPKIAAKPIISQTVWYGIAASLVLLLVFSFFSPASESQSAFFSRLSNYAPSGRAFTGQWSAIPQVYSLTIIGLAALLLIDYFLRGRWQFHSKTARL